MDPKELRGLMEAYSEVYAPQEVDEAITSEKGKAKAAEMIAKRSTPSGRAKSGQGASVAQIKHISRANVDGYGGTPPNLKVAKNPVKSNFTGLNTGTGNKAARRAAEINKEEFDIFDVVLEFLQAEGFAETLEEAEWMMANVIDEEAIDIILGEGVPLRGTTPDGKPWRVDPPPSGARQPAKMERNPKERKSPKERTSPKGGGYKSKLNKSDRYEEVEYVDEAQHARENPEKYEREQSKKYAPVRGEKTPMPPRGDKRREDFEKWYAKQMSR